MTDPGHVPQTHVWDLTLRNTFDEEPELYDRARPGYPPPLFEDLVRLAELGPHSRILEIGSGTGKATLPLARLGCNITAVELGPKLAALFEKNLRGYPQVQVQIGEFESWPLPVKPFDMVFAATAFHWVTGTARVRKATDALRSGGTLAVIETRHVRGGTVGFFDEIQDFFRRYRLEPLSSDFCPPPPAADIPDQIEADPDGRLDSPLFRRYEWTAEYTARGYAELLATYSSYRGLAGDVRAELLRRIPDLIDRRYGGRISKRYLTHLQLARKGSDQRGRPLQQGQSLKS